MKPEIRERWNWITQAYPTADRVALDFLIAEIERDAVERETGHEITWDDLSKEYHSACKTIASLTAEVERLKERNEYIETGKACECLALEQRNGEIDALKTAYDAQEQTLCALQASYIQETDDLKDELARLRASSADPARVERAAMALCHEPMTEDCEDEDYVKGVCPCKRYVAAANRILSAADGDTK